MEEEGGSYEARPWHHRRRLDPLRTYSGRIVYARPRHYFRPADARRILAAVIDETERAEDQGSWVSGIVRAIDSVTERMLAVILSAVGLSAIDAEDVLYGLKSIIRKLLGFVLDQTDPFRGQEEAIATIQFIAERAGLEVTIKER